MLTAPVSLWTPLALALAVTAACGSSSATTSAPASPAAPAATEAALTGTLLGHDGAPMPLAHVTVAGRDAVQVGADGSFRAPLPASGFAKVSFTGVDHGDHSIGLLLDGRPVRVDVLLGTYGAAEKLDGATVVELVFAPDGSISLGKTTPMERLADGRLHAALTTAQKPFAYEIRGIVAEAGRSMNGTDRSAFRYDGDGNYANVVEPDVEGAVEVFFDPTKTNPPAVATRVTFGVPDTTTARVATVYEAMHAHADPSSGPLFTPEQIDAEQDATVRQAMLIALFATLEPIDADGDPAMAMVAKRIMDELPPSSPLWSMAPSAAVAVSRSAGTGDFGYVEKVIEGLADEAAAAELLFRMMWAARTEGREDDVAAYYAIMTSKFANSPLARPAKMFDPSRAIRPGKPVPAFELADFDHPAQQLTPASFEGKTVLVEFWATWCGPCVEEMGNLHAAHEKFGPKGFEILSINVDDSADHVREFRAGQWQMPWSHVVLEGDAAAPVKAMFEANALPTQVLVGPDGRIVAIDPTLRGDGLTAALARLLGE